MGKLLSQDDFRGIKLSSTRVEGYLKIIKKQLFDELTPEQFLFAGVKFLITPGIIYVSKQKLKKFLQDNVNNNTPEVMAATVAFYAILKNLPPYKNLFFVQLFIKSIKDHPLMNDPKMWNLIYPLLPSKKIVAETSKVIMPQEKERKTKGGIIVTDNSDKKGTDEKTKRIIIP